MLPHRKSWDFFFQIHNDINNKSENKRPLFSYISLKFAHFVDYSKCYFYRIINNDIHKERMKIWVQFQHKHFSSLFLYSLLTSVPQPYVTERKKWFSGPDGYKWLGKELLGLSKVSAEVLSIYYTSELLYGKSDYSDWWCLGGQYRWTRWMLTNFSSFVCFFVFFVFSK